MPLTLDHAEPDPVLDGIPVFVSASIPDPARWQGPFDALEITDAVVALARSFLTAGARLVTAAHPTIAPLLLAYPGGEARELAARRLGEAAPSDVPPLDRLLASGSLYPAVWRAVLRDLRDHVAGA